MVSVRSLTPTSLSSAIASEQIDKNTSRATENLTVEIRRLGTLMQEDSAGLQSKGISADFIVTAEPLAETLEQNEYAWANAHFGEGNALTQWTALKQSGIDARDNLYDHLDAAYTDEPDKMKLLEAIGESNVNEDLLMEIPNLVALGRDNLALLQSVGYTSAMLDQTEALGHQLAALYAQSRPGTDPKTAKTMLQRAKNLAIRWMHVVRKFGKLANNGNPDRQKAYNDPYLRAANSKRDAQKPASTVASAPASTTGTCQ